jgi:ribonucleoside-diphosphate reductase alpha subunit
MADNNNYNINMQVIKRDGRKEPIQFDKITARIKNICTENELKYIDPIYLAQQTIKNLKDGITTEEIDMFSSHICVSLAGDNPTYSNIAGKLCISNLQKKTSNSFYETVKKLYDHRDFKDNHVPLVSYNFYKAVDRHRRMLDKAIDYDRDFKFDYFGYKTLERAYLMRLPDRYGNDQIIERPQHLWMRVAVGIHMNNMEKAIETYHHMSQGFFTHATPTLFNAGTNRPQCSSCYLLGIEDSIEGIYHTLTNCAKISKWAGGIGLHISNIRGSGSRIRGTNGKSNGLVPMLKVFNETARYVDQGGGKRKGSIAVYIEPHHVDIFDFLELKLPTGSEELRARDLFLALWVSDLFMERVRDNKIWSLMCPDVCPGLNEVYGDEYTKLYEQYEKEGKFKKQVPAQELWKKIYVSLVESGTPYIASKDAINRKCNQKNLGTIKSSNLCIEITEFTSKDEVAVCNLGSIALSKFVKEDLTYDHDKLKEVAKMVTRNLNNVIDINYYPIPETRRSNIRHRPIGLGVQGLADTYIKMRIPFDSLKAKQLNRELFETLYFGACEASNEMSRERGEFFQDFLAKNEGKYPRGYTKLKDEFDVLKWGKYTVTKAEFDMIMDKDVSNDIKGSYLTFRGSPFSEGKFQFDLWEPEQVHLSGRWDWDKLRTSMVRYGMRNSLLTALMPTASTAQILGNNSCFEPFTSNIYKRKTLAGEFTVVNKYLVNDLIELGLWDKNMKEMIIADNGSVQSIESVPKNIKRLYKTIWEIKQTHIVTQAAERGVFVDQSQSMNIFMAKPDFNKVTAMLFTGWRLGLKSLLYYLRSKPASSAVQFSTKPNLLKKNEVIEEDDDECLMCSG